MPRVAVRILHQEPGESAGELTRLLARARALAADDLARRFLGAGADDVRIVAGEHDGLRFGARLRSTLQDVGRDGLVVLGSGSIPLASDAEIAGLVAVGSSGERRSVTNNRYSSDVLAIGDASVLTTVPDVPSDNVLPRWLASVGVAVEELEDRTRLALDLDSPLDLEILRRHRACPSWLAELAHAMRHRLEKAREAFDGLTVIASDSRMELLVAGRLSASTLRLLETGTACRIRAFVEERGLRASATLEDEPDDDLEGDDLDLDPRDRRRRQRRPAAALGLLLDRDGPQEIGMLVGRLADGALIDTRVLLAHRHGADESGWPSAEDRFASDLLLGDRVRDPWLQQLTLHAWSHVVPIALGGHTLVGPGLPLALRLA